MFQRLFHIFHQNSLPPQTPPETSKDSPEYSINALIELGYLTSEDVRTILSRGFSHEDIIAQVLDILLKEDTCPMEAKTRMLKSECLCASKDCPYQ